jgi:small subunit ribosomal protein S15
MLNKQKKKKIIEKHKIHQTDTGSAEVQIGILSEEIQKLTGHLKKHPKDNHSRRGLLGMVSKRKRLLGWLEGESEKRYKKIIKELELKK